MTFLAAVGFILLGIGLGGLLASWLNNEMPVVDATKPFRLKAGGRRVVVMIAEARLDSNGSASGNFIDWDRFKKVRREQEQ